MTDHLTTTNTGHYAGTWHDLPDGTRRYYTHAHIAHMKALEGRASPANPDAIAKVRERHNRDRREAAKRTETARRHQRPSGERKGKRHE